MENNELQTQERKAAWMELHDCPSVNLSENDIPAVINLLQRGALMSRQV